MKKQLLFLLLLSMILILAACGGKAYKEALEKGYDNLEIQAYEDALENFTEAYDVKEKEPAKTGKETAQTMIEAWDAFDAGEWEDAIELADKILSNNSDDKAITISKDDAEKLAEQAEELALVEKDMTEKIEEAKELMEDDLLEDAKELLEAVIATPKDHPVIEDIIASAEELLKEVEEKIEQDKNDQADDEDNSEDEDDTDTNDATDDESTNDTNDNDTGNTNDNDDNDDESDNNDETDNNQSTEQGLSKDEATSILRNALSIPDEVKVNVDREEGDNYIIQVFEVVGEGEGSHTATWGWYKVNKMNGDWEEAF